MELGDHRWFFVACLGLVTGGVLLKPRPRGFTAPYFAVPGPRLTDLTHPSPLPVLKAFEREALARLLSSSERTRHLEPMIDQAQPQWYRWTGGGYEIALSHDEFEKAAPSPDAKIAVHADGIRAEYTLKPDPDGFVLYLDCAASEPDDYALPEDFRRRDVRLRDELSSKR